MVVANGGVPALSPHTPCDMFAALALSPSLATAGHRSAVAALHFSPPTPSATCTATNAGAGAQMTSLPSPFYSPTSGDISAAVDDHSERTDADYTHRPLTLGEARQLGLLLMQQLLPVRNDLKGTTRESILLADKLHDAGVRWDKHRRVMGLHLRSIWEEGQRFGNGRVASGHNAMELYIQGSFLSVAEEPHPLDPMPLPIEVAPTSFAHFPKPTLQAGLASSLPGGPAYMSQADLTYPPRDPLPLAHYSWDDDLPVGANTGKSDLAEIKRRLNGAKSTSWRDRKKAGLKIQVQAPAKRGLRTVAHTPRVTATVLSAGRNTFAAGIFTRKSVQWLFGLRGTRLGSAAPIPAAAKSARRVSVGGYEVR